MTKIQQLYQLGQSIWYDFIRRSLMTSGELQKLIDEGLRGMTSNPTIFDKAISGSSDYDDDLKELVKQYDSVPQIYEALALKDIGMAADLLLPVYEESNAGDGFVSLEVSPELAYRTDETIREAKKLYQALNRPNIMIKVPATQEGLPAVTKLIGSGVNVNVTLIFSLDNYRQVAAAYIEGLQKLAAAGPTVKGGHTVKTVASVASFFVSRVDTYFDKELEKIGNRELQGKIAVANAKVSYRAFKEIFSGKTWDELQAKGARKQRVLWASTSTKNPAYPPLLYVDELIGPETVNTVPPATYDTFMQQGKVELTLERGLEEAQEQIAKLADLGIDYRAVTQQLQDDGVEAFAKSFRSLMESIDEKRKKLLG